MQSPILVTGALGSVGTEVGKRLRAAGEKIRATDLAETKIKERFGEAVEAIRFDFSIRTLIQKLSTVWKKCSSCARRTSLM